MDEENKITELESKIKILKAENEKLWKENKEFAKIAEQIIKDTTKMMVDSMDRTSADMKEIKDHLEKDSNSSDWWKETLL
jgi:primosomal protein N''